MTSHDFGPCKSLVDVGSGRDPPEGALFAVADDVCNVPFQGVACFSASKGKKASGRLRFQSVAAQLLIRSL